MLKISSDPPREALSCDHERTRKPADLMRYRPENDGALNVPQLPWADRPPASHATASPSPAAICMTVAGGRRTVLSNGSSNGRTLRTERTSSPCARMGHWMSPKSDSMYIRLAGGECWSQPPPPLVDHALRTHTPSCDRVVPARARGIGGVGDVQCFVNERRGSAGDLELQRGIGRQDVEHDGDRPGMYARMFVWLYQLMSRLSFQDMSTYNYGLIHVQEVSNYALV